MKEIMIGYDIREMWLDTESFWNEERRKEFLLKQQVKKPISVDNTVWPSIYNLDIAEPIDYMRAIPRSKNYKTKEWDNTVKNHKVLSIPNHTGWLGDLWNELSVVKQNTSVSWSNKWKPCWIIAITQFTDAIDETDVEKYSSYFVTPQEINSLWTLLGYDVADTFLTGFISNAGYTDDEVEPLRREWVEYFNQWHLFNDFDLARKYVDVAYKRDFNHGPFEVFGIYGIEQIELGKCPKD